MEAPFNPLLSRTLFAEPKRTHPLSAWNEHVPFAMFLVELQRPRTIVELGTQWGVSFGAFCQAVAQLELSTACSAVDTWKGDKHTGELTDEVYADVRKHFAPYGEKVELLRMTFEEALGKFADRSVDLLHIDGLHTYEAVKRDFDSWLPKVSERGIILFHDTAVFEGDFGVYKLWAEVSRDYPHFEFQHGMGLGVLFTGNELPSAVINFLHATETEGENVRKLFVGLGGYLQAQIIAQAKRDWWRGLAGPKKAYFAIRECARLLLGRKPNF